MLKIPKRRWTPKEDQYLIDNFLSMGAIPIAEELQRTPASVYIHAKHLGLCHEWRWTKDQIQYLIQNTDKCPREIGEALGFTADQVQRKSYDVRVRLPKDPEASAGGSIKWTEEETQFLLANYKKISLEDLSLQLGKRKPSIVAKAARLGLSFKKAPKWSKEEISLLNELYKTYSLLDISSKMNRSPKAIKVKLNSLGLNSKSTYRQDTKPELLVKKALDDLGVGYESQVRISPEKTRVKRGFFKVDFLVKDYLVIEVLGDYFHCNPFFYSDGPIDTIQETSVNRDIERRRKLCNSGYNQLELWQHTIEDNWNLVFSLISTLVQAPKGETPWCITA